MRIQVLCAKQIDQGCRTAAVYYKSKFEDGARRRLAEQIANENVAP